MTGRSAATLRGVVLARPWDPVELVAPLRSRIARRQGLDVRRTDLEATEWEEWHGIGLATPERTALDVLLDRSLPDAVADLDVLLRSGLVERDTMQAALAPRHDRASCAPGRPSGSPIRAPNHFPSRRCGSGCDSRA